MTVHKLTAGDGYTYLTRQVAANDATNRGYDGLGAYYSDRGEAPGRWVGTGLSALPELQQDPTVTEAQMRALFGEGRHPNAEQLELAALQAGMSSGQVEQVSKLGQRFRVNAQAGEFARRSAGAFRDYNRARGQLDAAAINPDVRASIRTDLATRMFTETFGRGPVDARELSGHLARISRSATSAVAGFDLSFSPVKSVSTLWAIAPGHVAEEIERAHDDAVADTLGWLEQHAAYTRRGRNGIAQVDVRGLIGAQFTHRDSRAGDPDLHTHLAISNKVQAEDGTWLALDGRLLFRNNVAASERYNTRLEALLIDRLGVTFADRPGTDPGKRPIREIVGIDGPLPARWSRRRAAIDLRRADLSARFQSDHGRPPTAAEAIALAQRANLETRQAKHAPRSYAEQRTTWRSEGIAALGGENALGRYIHAALRPTSRRGNGGQRRAGSAVDKQWVATAAQTVVQTVSSTRATWREHHVRAEAERYARAAGVPLADLDRAVDNAVREALSDGESVLLDTHEDIPPANLTPARLKRRDGSSIYTVAGSRLYTSAAVMAAERQILTAAGRRDGRTVDVQTVELTLLESAANGVELNPGQAQLVRDLATSGARVQLALAPAGTGKTTAMHALSRAWTSPTGTSERTRRAGSVVGLAPSAAAAAVLREEIGGQADTLAKLIHTLSTTTTTSGGRGAAGAAPAWVSEIGPHTLVIIDEAGMAGTIDLARTIGFVLSRGASVRLVGDDQQLAAIGAGGVLRDIARTHGAVTLSQVMRFTHPADTCKPAAGRGMTGQAGRPNHAEGAASLALRDGDPAAVAYYLDRGRVHVGDLTTVTDQAYRGWQTDRAGGLDAVMLAPTRDLVLELNTRARNDRLTQHSARMTTQSGSGTGVAGALSREVRLIDGSRASAGDTVITRHNERRIPTSATDWVKNGDRWTVMSVVESGAMRVRHVRTRRTITIPASYVAEHVTLGYASTVHGAQGVTADTAHTISAGAAGAESRQLLYVAMTRGRHANHIYLNTAGDGDPHSVITRDALVPPTAGDLLARILDRDSSPVSATTQTAQLTDPALRLGAAAGRYQHALAVGVDDALHTRYGTDAGSRLEQIAEQTVAGVTAAPAWPALRARLALRALDGHSPAADLRAAAGAADLTGVRDVAAVLDGRLHTLTQHSPAGPAETETAAFGAAAFGVPAGPVPSPLPWLPATPVALAAENYWGVFLRGQAAAIHHAAAELTAAVEAWTPASAPVWAVPFLDRATDPTLLVDLAVWRAATVVSDTDRRPVGLPAHFRHRGGDGPPDATVGAGEVRAQAELEHRVGAALGGPGTDAARWQPLARALDPQITTDPYWPVLAERLTAAERAGLPAADLLSSAAALRPLPDEQPAAALWWRLADHLAPAAATATADSKSGQLTPTWNSVLTDLLGPDDAARVRADAAWPALVTAVSAGTTTAAAGHDTGHDGNWTAAQLLSTAHELLRAGQPDDQPLRSDELATALVWRVALLTDPTISGPTDDTDPDASSANTAGDLDPIKLPADLDRLQFADYTAGTDHDDLPRSRRAEPDREPAHDEPEPDHPKFGSGSQTVELSADQPIGRDISATPPRHRLLQLNQLAADFYIGHFAGSWAPAYLQQRLGTDLTGDSRFPIGYAPNSWTALVDHLHESGASGAEIVAAGLGSYARSGHVIDRFRDRLIIPIHEPNRNGQPAPGPMAPGATAEIVGFIGRRNPTNAQRTDPDRDRQPFSSPKYLNTADTALFRKGGVLYGLTENTAALAAGATPVLVEGPLDAIAVSLAAGSRYAGLATMGTALTDQQADLITRAADTANSALPGGAGRVLVATDNDAAGRKAAHAAFWKLTTRGITTDRPDLPVGSDPADALTNGKDLAQILGCTQPLANLLIDDRTRQWAYRFDTPEGRVGALRASIPIITALPQPQWAQPLARLVATTGIDAAVAIEAALDRAAASAGTGPAADPINRRAFPAIESAVAAPRPASHRWTHVAEHLAPGILNDVAWADLADAIDRAAEAGYDVTTVLAGLTDIPLPPRNTARSLELRLADACPESVLPRTSSTPRADPSRPTSASSITSAAPTHRTPPHPHSQGR